MYSFCACVIGCVHVGRHCMLVDADAVPHWRGFWWRNWRDLWRCDQHTHEGRQNCRLDQRCRKRQQQHENWVSDLQHLLSCICSLFICSLCWIRYTGLILMPCNYVYVQAIFQTISYRFDWCKSIFGVEENSSVFSLIQMRWLPSARTCGQ